MWRTRFDISPDAAKVVGDEPHQAEWHILENCQLAFRRSVVRAQSTGANTFFIDFP